MLAYPRFRTHFTLSCGRFFNPLSEGGLSAAQRLVPEVMHGWRDGLAEKILLAGDAVMASGDRELHGLATRLSNEEVVRVFDEPLAEVSRVTFPWFYLLGNLQITAESPWSGFNDYSGADRTRSRSSWRLARVSMFGTGDRRCRAHRWWCSIDRRLVPQQRNGRTALATIRATRRAAGTHDASSSTAPPLRTTRSAGSVSC